MKKRLIFLVGPTAVGKSDVARSLAKKVNAEIISCDSMQIYKGMEIITSAPSPATRRSLRHHLLGKVSPTQPYDVSRYRRAALAALRDIIKRGKVPLFVGGTGLYMSIVIDGIFPSSPEDKEIRKKLYALALKPAGASLYDRLQRVDPAAASKIHPNDTRRIVRALEVFMTTGKPISQLQRQRKGLREDYDISIFCLTMDKEKLNDRIQRRVEHMFRQGLMAEVRRLLRLRLSRTASYAIGLRELKEYFDGGIDLNEAKRRIIHNTRLYAKRQLTWFRKDPRIRWIEVKESQTPAYIAEKIWKEHF